MKMRFIPTSVHGAVDHVVGPALVLAPTLLRLGRTSPEGLTARAVGGAEAFYSNLTDYELSMKNVVPMKVHLVLDAVGGATLALVPQLTGARKRGKKHWLPHLAIGATGDRDGGLHEDRAAATGRAPRGRGQEAREERAQGEGRQGRHTGRGQSTPVAPV